MYIVVLSEFDRYRTATTIPLVHWTHATGCHIQSR